MAARHQWAHAARFGERQRFQVVGFATLGIEPVGMGRNVAEQMERVGRKPCLRRKGLDRAVAQTQRVVEPAELQTGSSQQAVGPAAKDEQSPSRMMVEELLCFPDSFERVALLAELR